MISRPVAVTRNFPSFLVLSGALALWACQPNVVIGAKLAVEGEPAGEGGSGGVASGGSAGAVASAGSNVGGGVGGSEPVVAGASGSGDAGAPSAGAGGAPPEVESWCATSEWASKAAVTFVNDDGNVIPAGNYVLTYVSGAQLHDPDLGFEVTGHYYYGTIEAGHHLFSGDALGEVGATKLWLEDAGTVKLGPTGTVAAVEEANKGYPWPFSHVGGELHITFLDNDYSDNKGPGSRFCVSAAAPP